MKSVQVDLYEFSELSDDAKEKARMDYISHGDYFYTDEAQASLKAFEDIFPVDIREWNIGWGGKSITYNFTDDDYIAVLSGWRLSTYIWNKYRFDLYKGKYYSKGKYENGRYTYKSRYSKIILQSRSCPLTGACYDEDLLDPLWKFMEHPDNTTFRELLDDCLHSWLKTVDDEDEYLQTDEAFKETCEANEWLFTKEGKLWQ